MIAALLVVALLLALPLMYLWNAQKIDEALAELDQDEVDDVMAIVDAVQDRAELRPCGHSVHDLDCIDPDAVERIRARVQDELEARRARKSGVRS